MILCVPKDFKHKYMRHCYLKVLGLRLDMRFFKGRGSQIVDPSFSRCEKKNWRRKGSW